MYYITKKDTETGKKFQILKQKLRKIRKKQKKIADKFKLFCWIDKPFQIAGQIWLVSFKEGEKIDLKNWKKYKNKYYLPKLNTKKGKEIQAEFDDIPIISWEELNACVDIKENHFHIGFNFSEEYFGFTAKEEWEVEIPADCEEITFTQWKEIFKEEIK